MSELQTGVDQLIELVKEKQRISLQQASEELHIEEKIVQAWVDFLVEEHVLGIEYKFTTPYIYVNDEERLESVHEDDEQYTLSDFREIFYAFAKEKNMPQDNLAHLWRVHLEKAIDSQKRMFIRECEQRGLTGAEQLFINYKEEMIHGT